MEEGSYASQQHPQGETRDESGIGKKKHVSQRSEAIKETKDDKGMRYG